MNPVMSSFPDNLVRNPHSESIQFTHASTGGPDCEFATNTIDSAARLTDGTLRGSSVGLPSKN
jgi:hypothetical protein